MDERMIKMDPDKDIVEIFKNGVEKVNPFKLIIENLKLDDETLEITFNNGKTRLNLQNFNKVFIIGSGKATARMAKGIEEVLGNRITEGVISVKYGHTETLKKIKVIEAGHPIPDENSIRAGIEIAKLSKKADEKTLVINLISGGASALVELPPGVTGGASALVELPPGVTGGASADTPSSAKMDSNRKISKGNFISLEEIKSTTDALLRCGATIDEINCIRKHISGIKGGRLAELIYPGTCISLILSDVIGDRIDSIGSGPTAPDNTTYREALEIIQRHEIERDIPRSVLSLLKAGAEGKIPETPGEEHPAFSKICNFIIGSNYTAVRACEQKAMSLGYNTLLLSAHLIGEASEVAKLFTGISEDIEKYGIPVQKPGCVIARGETTVTIRGNGKGGRNQEIALSFLCEYLRNWKTKNKKSNIWFVSVATDGNDGPTDAAGAIVSEKVITETIRKSLNPEKYLRNNDSYHFFEKTGGLIKTGPTNTNVCDIQILIVT